MECITESSGSVTVAKISGSIDGARGVDLAKVPCLELKQEDVVLDLEGVDFMDSMGLGVLVGILQGFEKAGKKIVLAAPAPIVAKTLTITGINRIIDIVDSVEDAFRVLS